MKKLSVLLLIIPSVVLAAHQIANNIKIAPLSATDFPINIKNDINTYNKNVKIKGYHEIESDYPKKLLRMSYEPQKFSKSNNQEDTQLRKKLSDLKLNFKYTSISTNTIGYAGLGLYTNNGWSGVKEFFDNKKLGTCSFSVFNISNVGEPMILNEDGLTYDINDKPTRITIEGSQNSGFMYSVRWYDANFVRDIECANLKFDKEIINEMIFMAKNIDLHNF